MLIWFMILQARRSRSPVVRLVANCISRAKYGESPILKRTMLNSRSPQNTPLLALRWNAVNKLQHLSLATLVCEATIRDKEGANGKW